MCCLQIMTNTRVADLSNCDSGSKTHADDETDFISFEAAPAAAAPSPADHETRLCLLEQQLADIRASISQQSQDLLRGCMP